jgi:hypothetical protein
MQAHFPLTIEPQHFDRWLALFEQSTADVSPPTAAVGCLVPSGLWLPDDLEVPLLNPSTQGDVGDPHDRGRCSMTC